jgi:hypothetical protein
MQQEQMWTLPEQFGRINVSGYTVEAVDGRVGKVDHATLEPGSSSLIVDTRPAFLGKKLLLPAGLVSGVDRDDQVVYVACTEDEINSAPAFDRDRYQDPVYQDQIAAYYAAGSQPAEQEADQEDAD